MPAGQLCFVSGGMMGKVRRLCLWLLVFIFGLPAVGGSGLHTILPHDTDAFHHCGASAQRDFSLGGFGAVLCTACASHAEDECFLCRFFLRHTVGWFFLAVSLFIGLIVPLAAASPFFFSPCFDGSPLARSPPAAVFLFA